MAASRLTGKNRLMNHRRKERIEKVPSNMALVWKILEPFEHRRILILSMASIAVNALDILSADAIAPLGIVAIQYRNSSEIAIYKIIC